MYDVSALGFGDNVVDKYMHIHTMYPGDFDSCRELRDISGARGNAKYNRIHCGGEICQTGYRGLLPLLRISVLPEFYDGQTGVKVEKPFFQHRDSFWGMESAVLPFTLRPDEGSGVKRHIRK